MYVDSVHAYIQDLFHGFAIAFPSILINNLSY